MLVVLAPLAVSSYTDAFHFMGEAQAQNRYRFKAQSSETLWFIKAGESYGCIGKV